MNEILHAIQDFHVCKWFGETEESMNVNECARVHTFLDTHIDISYSLLHIRIFELLR